MGRACSQNGERWNAFKILAGKPTGRIPVGRPRNGWEDTIRSNIKEKLFQPIK